MLICIFMSDIDQNQLEDRFKWIVRHMTCLRWPPEGIARWIFWMQLHKAILN